MVDERLTVEQAAEQHQMNPDSIRRFLSEGALLSREVGARQWRIAASALPALIEHGDQNSAQSKGE